MTAAGRHDANLLDAGGPDADLRDLDPLDVDLYERNLIGGRWRFPALPYEYEIRSPRTGEVIATVPLSSRLDVAQAVEAARHALRAERPAPDAREEPARSLLGKIVQHRAGLARLQATETGIEETDSLRTLDATVSEVARHLRSTPTTGRPGVSGHILSWGLPLTEAITSTIPPIARGDTVILKPSLRAPLSAAAVARLAAEAGLPPGVVNVVQGTGVDAGTALIGADGLAALQVRGGSRVSDYAARGPRRPRRYLAAGGNAVLVGPDGEPPIETIVAALTAGVRLHSAGGPFGLPLVAIHRRQKALPAMLAERLRAVAPAPLATEALRLRALDRVRALLAAGALPLAGGTEIPDDIAHRMGWRLPPTVLFLGDAGSPAVQVERTLPPLGPVLSIVVWDGPADLAALVSPPRARQGVAYVCGVAAPPGIPSGLPHAVVRRSFEPMAVPVAWMG
jgi:acyl-CoA reductase-like NAD-dependent aldehyde dehydrogenase